MTISVELDLRFAQATISSGNLARVSLSGATVSSIDEGKRVSIDIGASSAHQSTIDNFVNSTTFDLAAPVPSAITGKRIMIGTDNAPVIQDAIDNQVDVELPGDWIGCGAIDGAGAGKANTLIGIPGPFSRGTWLHPFCDSGTFLDFWGQSSLTIEGISFGFNSNPNKPDAGLLIGGPVDHLRLSYVAGSGFYRKACMAAVSGGLGSMRDCTFWNFGDGFAMAFDLNNSRGFTSSITITGPYALAPWSFDRCEAHAGAGSNAQAILYRGLDDAIWNGFIISGKPGQAGIVRVEDTSGSWSGMRRHNYPSGRFEAEDGTPVNIFDAQGECVNCHFGPVMWGMSGNIVIGSSAAGFRSNCTGLPGP